MKMDQEHDELDLQDGSNNMFDNFSNKVEEHPKEASGAILALLGTSIAFGVASFCQWIKNRKEQKRHEEVENLQKTAIQKHDAQIRDYKDLCDENERLKKLNNSLCDALVEKSEGGESGHEG